jgi:hypothetical protein
MFERRPLIFLAVLMSHAVIVLLLVRSARQAIPPPGRADEPLVLLLLHELTQAATERTAARRPTTAATAHAAKREPVPDNSIAVAPAAPEPPAPPPPIDWQHEGEVAARDGVAAAEKEKNYRDLSALSRAQLSWSRQNHMVRAAPGIQWTHPRLEFMPNGLPIFWINDHCVLVTVMVFCSIGHIEANGGLFNHMRDPHDP